MSSHWVHFGASRRSLLSWTAMRSTSGAPFSMFHQSAPRAWSTRSSPINARAETFRFESNRTRFIVAHEMLQAIIAKPSLSSGPVSSTFPICMEGPIRFPLAGSVVRDHAETFRISPPNTEIRKGGPGAYSVRRRPKKRCKQAVLARRLPIPGWYAADQMGKVEVRRRP